MKSVAVAIVNWNSGPWLGRCLDALARQSRVPDPIVVIDNASTDGSEGCANRSGVTLLRSETNEGFAAACNRGIEATTADFIALLNPDALPKPDWLERLMEAARAHPEASSFASRQMLHGSPGVLDGVGDVYHISGLPWRRGHGRLFVEGQTPAGEIFGACAAAALYRRQAVVDAGGFDEAYFCYCEDVDLAFRLRLAGHTSRYVPDAVVEHVGSATSGGRHSDFVVYHGHRNLVWTYMKNMPGILFWALLPLHLAMNVASIVWFSLKGQGGVILRAKWDAIKRTRSAWKERKDIQKERRASARDIWRMLEKTVIPVSPWRQWRCRSGTRA